MKTCPTATARLHASPTSTSEPLCPQSPVPCFSRAYRSPADTPNPRPNSPAPFLWHSNAPLVLLGGWDSSSVSFPTGLCNLSPTLARYPDNRNKACGAWGGAVPALEQPGQEKLNKRTNRETKFLLLLLCLPPPAARRLLLASSYLKRAGIQIVSPPSVCESKARHCGSRGALLPQRSTPHTEQLICAGEEPAATTLPILDGHVPQGPALRGSC